LSFGGADKVMDINGRYSWLKNIQSDIISLKE
jgi:hypothetical protein